MGDVDSGFRVDLEILIFPFSADSTTRTSHAVGSQCFYILNPYSTGGIIVRSAAPFNCSPKPINTIKCTMVDAALDCMTMVDSTCYALLNSQSSLFTHGI